MSRDDLHLIWLVPWLATMGLLKVLIPPLGRKVENWWYRKEPAPA